MTSANDSQVGGSHYKAGLQHWDYAIIALENRYLEGNITKYVVRHRKKNGLQDLEKAAHYLDKLKEAFLSEKILPMVHTRPMPFDLSAFCIDNGLNTFETYIVRRIASWRDLYDLKIVEVNLNELIITARETARRADATKAGAGYVDQDR